MKRDDVRLSASPDDGDAADDTEGETSSDTVRYRTLWISDLHLGTPGCQAKALLDFLRRTECETLFLVGDIIDGWQLRRQWFWPQAPNDVRAKELGSAAVLLALVLCFVTWVLLAGPPLATLAANLR